jgi:hypothetical protein
VAPGRVVLNRNPKQPGGRFRDRVRARLDFHLNQLFLQRHPGPVLNRVIAALGPLVRLLTPNDKWTLAAHLPFWLKAFDAPPMLPLPQSRRIFMLCAYRGQFTLDFAISIMLAWRGHHITIGYLPKLQSPIKKPIEDGPSARPYLADVLANVESLSGGRIRCVDLSNEVLDDVPLDENFIEARVKSDIVMYFGRETLDRSDPEIGKVWDRFEAQARQSQKLAWNYLQKNRNRFDLCVIANGTTFEGAQFCHVARSMGLPFNTHERFAFRKVRTPNHGDDFRNFSDLETSWRYRERLGYTSEPFYRHATDRAFGLLEERRKASRATWSWTLQNSPNQSTEQALVAAGLSTGDTFVLVCPNVPFDAGYDGLLGLFPSMRDWLVDTVRHLLEKTSIHVVVRAHPAEVALGGGKERSEEILAEFLDHPRLTLIAHDRTVNTYGLMETCKFGVVFSSTTGLEMAMMGKTVVVGANLYYGRKGYTIESDSRTEYCAALMRLAEMKENPGLTERQMLDARLFHFMLHFVMQWPYPYDKASDILALPYHELLRSPEMKKYVPFLDAMTLPEAEWHQRITEFLGAGGDNHVVATLANAHSH